MGLMLISIDHHFKKYVSILIDLPSTNYQRLENFDNLRNEVLKPVDIKLFTIALDEITLLFILKENRNNGIHAGINLDERVFIERSSQVLPLPLL